MQSIAIICNSHEFYLNCRNENLIPDKGWAFWRVDNSAGTFFVEPVIGNKVSMPRGYELRHAIISYTVFPVNETKPSTSTDQPIPKISRTVSERPQQGQEGAKALMSTTASASSQRMYEHVTEFKRIWWDEGSKFWKGISIWRPVVQPEFAILGDVAVKGYVEEAAVSIPQVAELLRSIAVVGCCCNTHI
jgi:hypothetical protein